MDLGRVRRLGEELSARPLRTSPDELRALAARTSPDGATITVTRRGREDDAPSLGDALARGTRASSVVLAPGLYASLAGTEARVALLGLASSLGERMVLHAHVEAAPTRRTRAARALLDGPRALARDVAGLVGRPSPLPEAGDRLEGGRFVHVFADEEPLLREIDAAGLAAVARAGDRWELAPAAESPSRSDAERLAVAREIARALRLLPRAERARQAASPERAVEEMRALGRASPARDAIGRARLRRAIGWADALPPGGPNCYRRTLLELALDARAAEEPLVFGLDVGGTGHVAFAGREELGFDVLFEIGPGP